MTLATTTDTECPECGKEGKTLAPLTLRALLKDEFAGQIADADYRFCDAKDCNFVYFGNGQTFSKSQLNVAVGVKETQGKRPLCYCFGHSVATLKEEIRTKGQSDALQDIRKKMKDPGCACEVKNPSGTCCLGTFAKGIEDAKSELFGTAPTAGKAETISKVGTCLSAIMASSCCWLPLVLLAYGVSGAGIAGTLDTYRPLFIGLTAMFLAAAFYYTYRPHRMALGSAACCKTANACCATPTIGPRFGATTLNKVMLWGSDPFWYDPHRPSEEIPNACEVLAGRAACTTIAPGRDGPRAEYDPLPANRLRVRYQRRPREFGMLLTGRAAVLPAREQGRRVQADHRSGKRP
jgi:hypothetical protein